MHLKHRYQLFLVAAALVVALLPTPAAAASSVTLVTWGLDSPRGIVFLGSSAVVAEAGHGSTNPADCFPTSFGTTCVGNTSRITWVDVATGAKSPLATGFFSIALDPTETIGVSGLAVMGGKLFAQIGATAREVPPQFAIRREAGDLISVDPSTGRRTTIAGVGDQDFHWTTQFPQPNPSVCGPCPGTQEHDANPTGVLATGNGWYVADSGANTLTKVAPDGSTTIAAHFPWRNPNPTFPSDEVPTCVTQSGGALWIGTLSGHLFSFSGGVVTEVTPMDSSGHPLLSHVTGCTSRGSELYLVNMFGPGTFGDATFADGSVVQYDTASGKGSMLADAFGNPALFLPYMDTFGPDGMLYVTSGAVCGKAGTNPFGGGPNPCTLGHKKGGRVVKLTV